MILPKAVVFDLGKVLLDFDYGIAVRQLEPRCRLPSGELRRLIDQSPLLHQYESNQLSTPAFFLAIQAATGFAGDLTEFRSMFADIFTPIPAMVRLHRDLRKSGSPTYIFSNTNEIAVAHIRNQFPFFGDFDGYILSFEQQAMKPDHRLYEVVERVTTRRGPDLLYIDDRPENIVAGRERGWRTILHQDPAATEAAVRETGLLAALPRSGPAGGSVG